MRLVDYVLLHPPGKLALVDGDDRLTYGELAERVASRAEELVPGRGHLLSGESPIEFTIDYLAAHLSGAVAVPKGPLPQEPGEIADLLYTTGTTGLSKGVRLTHDNILCAARQINNYIGNACEDRELLCLPLHHSFGLGRLRCNLLAGSTVIFCDGMKRIGHLFRIAEEWSVTGMALVPAGVALLLPFASKLAALPLRYLELGSSPMPRNHKEQLLTLLPHCRICMHYGMTEASRSAFTTLGSDPLDSIGRPTPGVEIEVRGGELHVRGKMVMAGYLGEERQEEWFATGDLGWQDERGYLYLSGRKGEVINVGGEKVLPLEVEVALERHASVEEAMCVALSDPIAGERVKAFLVGQRVDERELIGHLELEPYKVPVQFEWVDTLPRTASGKLIRRGL